PDEQERQGQIDELKAETGVTDSPSRMPIRRIIRIYSRPSISISACSGTSLASMTLDRTTSSSCATAMDGSSGWGRRRRRDPPLLITQRTTRHGLRGCTVPLHVQDAHAYSSAL